MSRPSSRGPMRIAVRPPYSVDIGRGAALRCSPQPPSTQRYGWPARAPDLRRRSHVSESSAPTDLRKVPDGRRQRSHHSRGVRWRPPWRPGVRWTTCGRPSRGDPLASVHRCAGSSGGLGYSDLGYLLRFPSARREGPAALVLRAAEGPPRRGRSGVVASALAGVVWTVDRVDRPLSAG
jgi:hypothetical protein